MAVLRWPWPRVAEHRGLAQRTEGGVFRPVQDARKVEPETGKSAFGNIFFVLIEVEFSKPHLVLVSKLTYMGSIWAQYEP